MNHYIPQVGDVIRINRGLYQHVGVYVGSRYGDGRDVVHNDKFQDVRLCTLAEFADGSPVFLHKQAVGNFQERQAIANRVIALIGRKYNLWNFNCEHLATLAQTGNAQSPQLAGLLMVAAVVFGLLLVARKK